MHSRILALALFTDFGLWSYAEAQDQGFGNATKRFVTPSQISTADLSEVIEMHRAWISAIVRVPTSNRRSKQLSTSHPLGLSPRSPAKFPAVVHLYERAGIWPGTHRRVILMANLGFVVVAPASFARQKHAKSCDPATNSRGLYRDTLKLRQKEAA